MKTTVKSTAGMEAARETQNAKGVRVERMVRRSVGFGKDSQTMKTKRLMLYIRGTEMSAETLDELRAAGYLPVAVDNFDAVRVVEPVPDANGSLLLRAAMKAIAEPTVTTSAAERLGMNLARVIGGKRENT